MATLPYPVVQSLEITARPWVQLTSEQEGQTVQAPVSQTHMLGELPAPASPPHGVHLISLFRERVQSLQKDPASRAGNCHVHNKGVPDVVGLEAKSREGSERWWPRGHSVISSWKPGERLRP